MLLLFTWLQGTNSKMKSCTRKAFVPEVAEWKVLSHQKLFFCTIHTYNRRKNVNSLSYFQVEMLHFVGVSLKNQSIHVNLNYHLPAKRPKSPPPLPSPPPHDKDKQENPLNNRSASILIFSAVILYLPSPLSLTYIFWRVNCFDKIMDPDPRFDLLFILKIEKKKIPNDFNFVSGVKFNF